MSFSKRAPTIISLIEAYRAQHEDFVPRMKTLIKKTPATLTFDNLREIHQAASDPELTADSFRAIVAWLNKRKAWNSQVGEALASNPSLPPDLLNDVATNAPEAFLSNVVIAMLRLENPTFFQELNADAQEAVFEAASRTGNTEGLFGHPQIYTFRNAIAVANHPKPSPHKTGILIQIGPIIPRELRVYSGGQVQGSFDRADTFYDIKNARRSPLRPNEKHYPNRIYRDFDWFKAHELPNAERGASLERFLQFSDQRW